MRIKTAQIGLIIILFSSIAFPSLTIAKQKDRNLSNHLSELSLARVNSKGTVYIGIIQRIIFKSEGILFVTKEGNQCFLNKESVKKRVHFYDQRQLSEDQRYSHFVNRIKSYESKGRYAVLCQYSDLLFKDLLSFEIFGHYEFINKNGQKVPAKGQIAFITDMSKLPPEPIKHQTGVDLFFDKAGDLLDKGLELVFQLLEKIQDTIDKIHYE